MNRDGHYGQSYATMVGRFGLWLDINFIMHSQIIMSRTFVKVTGGSSIKIFATEK